MVHDWYKDAIFYEVFVRAFFDSNGDGIGDLRGLTAKLDYLQWLGVDAIWMLPIFPSPLRDDGYDVSDYFNVHPDYGTLAVESTADDFRALVAEAHRRGLRVIVELIPNHTSDQNPWFQASRDPNHPEHEIYRDWYVWSETDEKYQGTRIIFLDYEPSNWTYDELRRAYYWHRFFHHQPDLNFDNPEVQRVMLRVLQFWVESGGGRLPRGRHALSLRAGEHQLRKPARDTCLSETDAPVRGRLRAGYDAALRGQSVAGGRAALLRQWR